MRYQRSPDALFSRLRRLPEPVLLAAGKGHGAENASPKRFDVLTADPIERLHWESERDALPPADALCALLARHNLPEHKRTSGLPDAPFTAGFIGYVGYPLHQQLERQTPAPPDPVQLPAMKGGYYDWAIVTDHAHETTTLYTRSGHRKKQVLSCLTATPPHSDVPCVGAFGSTLSQTAYRQAFDRVMTHIRAGDCYQVNLARHFEAPFSGSPWLWYQQLSERINGAFNAFLEYPQGAILSFSPERFVHFDGHEIVVWPIKGTAPRDPDPIADRHNAESLLHSEKDRAENLMIVDLVRNDLGRFCETGSIQVPHFCELLSLPNVHHLVSQVRGIPRSGARPADMLLRMFPCGSITGAPKIMAINLINTLEPVGRSVYCGAIGYINECGNMDFNVAIRTGVVAEGRAHFWGGGGIVADSDPDAELAEISAKIGRLVGALGV